MRNADALIELNKKRAKLVELLDRRISDKQRGDIKEAISRIDYAIATVKQRLLQEQDVAFSRMSEELEDKVDSNRKIIEAQKRRRKAREERAKMLKKMKQQSKSADSHGLIMTVIMFATVIVVGTGIIYYLWSTSYVPGAGIF